MARSGDGGGAILLVLGLIGLGYFGYSSAALILIVLAMIFFVAEALTPTFGLFTVAGVVTFILGGIMLFSGGGGEYLVSGETYSVLRVAIIAMAVLLGLFFLFGMAAVVRAAGGSRRRGGRNSWGGPLER